MTDSILELHTFTPLLFRDGRPFSGGNDESRAQSLPAPLPHTVAGFVRTQLGNKHGWNWRSDEAFHEYLTHLHNVRVQSLLVRDEQFMFPAPLNAVVDKQGKVFRSVPVSEVGTNLPAGLRPVMLNPQPDDAFKPEGGYAYWSASDMTTWLLNKTPDKLPKMSGLPTEERTHVSIDPQTLASKEGMLYGVTYRSFEEQDQDGAFHRWALRIRTNAAQDVNPIGHLGGERRPVALAPVADGLADWPHLKHFEAVKQKLLDESERRICFILTTPALFRDGWQPAWLTEDTASHTPRGVSVLRGKATLVGAAVGRRIPISGWNVRENQAKAVRWAAPAGSVYFLELNDNAELSVAEREKLIGAWLKPLSDDQNDQRDGFGCALWGVW